MGWTYTHRPEKQSIKDFLIIQLFTIDGETPSEHIELLSLAVKKQVGYGAVKDKTTNKVWGLVCHLNFAPSEHHNTGYKSVHEDMGPYETECPDRILDLLTPTTSESSNTWRTLCREYNNIKKAAPKLTDGCVIKLASGIKFKNGETLDTFQVVKRGRRTNYRNGNTNYHITNLNSRKYSIVNPTPRELAT